MENYLLITHNSPLSSSSFCMTPKPEVLRQDVLLVSIASTCAEMLVSSPHLPSLDATIW